MASDGSALMGSVILCNLFGNDLLQTGRLVRIQIGPELLPVIDGGEGLGRQTVGFGCESFLFGGIGFGCGLTAAWWSPRSCRCPACPPRQSRCCRCWDSGCCGCH